MFPEQSAQGPAAADPEMVSQGLQVRSITLDEIQGHLGAELLDIGPKTLTKVATDDPFCGGAAAWTAKKQGIDADPSPLGQHGAEMFRQLLQGAGLFGCRRRAGSYHQLGFTDVPHRRDRFPAKAPGQAFHGFQADGLERYPDAG